MYRLPIFPDRHQPHRAVDPQWIVLGQSPADLAGEYLASPTAFHADRFLRQRTQSRTMARTRPGPTGPAAPPVKLRLTRRQMAALRQAPIWRSGVPGDLPAEARWAAFRAASATGLPARPGELTFDWPLEGGQVTQLTCFVVVLDDEVVGLIDDRTVVPEGWLVVGAHEMAAIAGRVVGSALLRALLAALQAYYERVAERAVAKD